MQVMNVNIYVSKLIYIMIFHIDGICLKMTSWLLAKGLEKCYLAL